MAMILKKLKQWQHKRSWSKDKGIEDDCDDNYDTVDLEDIAPPTPKEPAQEQKVFDINEATENPDIVENNENPYYDGVYDINDEDKDIIGDEQANKIILQIEDNPYYDDFDDMNSESVALSNVRSSIENADNVIDHTELKEDGITKTNISFFQTEESNDDTRESSVQDDKRAIIVETNENFPIDEACKIEPEDEEMFKNDKTESMQITLSTQSSKSYKEDKGTSQCSTDEASLDITDNNQEKKDINESSNDNTYEDNDDKSSTNLSIKELMEDLSADLRRKLLFDDGLVNSLKKVKELLSQMKEHRTDKSCQDSSLCTALLALATRNDKIKISSIRISESYDSLKEEQLKELKEDELRQNALELPQDGEPSCSSNLMENDLTDIKRNHKSQDILLPIHFPSKDADTDPNNILEENKHFIHNLKNVPKSELASSCTQESNYSKNTSIICNKEDVDQKDTLQSDSLTSNDLAEPNPKDIPIKDEQLSQGLANIFQNANSLMLKIKKSSSEELLHEKIKIPRVTTSISPSILIEKDSKQNNSLKESMEGE